MNKLGRLLAVPFVWLWLGRRGVVAVLSLAAMAVGFWLAWKPLAFIVPGSLVLFLLVFARITGKE